MWSIQGICPSCGKDASCGLLENKLAAQCPSCKKPLFSQHRLLLKIINVLFLLPLVPAIAGVYVRRVTGNNLVCIGLIALAVVILFLILFCERLMCKRMLNPKKS